MYHTAVIPAADKQLRGDLAVFQGSPGLVIFAHGSGSSRFSPRNRYVARTLNDARISTLLLDLLTTEEERIDSLTRHLRFDVDLLAARLSYATRWALDNPATRDLRIGYFGASTGAAAALVAAAERPDIIKAVVSRGGRPDLAGGALKAVQSPTLLLVGEEDSTVLQLNQTALEALPSSAVLETIPRAGHLFEERGALEEVAARARDWFLRSFAEEQRRQQQAL